MCILEQYETLYVWGPDNRAPLSRKNDVIDILQCSSYYVTLYYLFMAYITMFCASVFFSQHRKVDILCLYACIEKKKTMKISKNNILARNYIKSKRHTSLVWCVFSTIKYSARRSLLSWVWSYHDSGSKTVQWDRK